MAVMCAECLPEHYIDTGRCIPCDAAQTKATGNINKGFKIVINLVLFLAPFWLLMQLRSIWYGIGGIIAIIGGVGKMPENPMATFAKMVISSLGFMNMDVQATRPGCGGTASTFVPVYWANLSLIMDYVLPPIMFIPCLYFVARLFTRLPGLRELRLVQSLFESWHDALWYRDRMWTCAVFWLDTSWYILVANSITAVIPGPVVGDSKVLFKSGAQKWMQEGHEYVFVISMIFLLCCCFIMPIWLTYFLKVSMA